MGDAISEDAIHTEPAETVETEPVDQEGATTVVVDVGSEADDDIYEEFDAEQHLTNTMQRNLIKKFTSAKYVKQYSPVLVAFIRTAHASGVPQRQISGELKIPVAVVNQIIRNPRYSSPKYINHDVVSKLQEVFPQRLKEESLRILNSISDEDMRKASLRDKAFAFDKFHTHFRLVEGHSTENIAVNYNSKKQIKSDKTRERSNLKSNDYAQKWGQK